MADRKESVAAHEHADLKREVASLKREVASLKKQLVSTPKRGGKDPRVDQLIEVLKGFHLHAGLVTKDIVKNVNNSENILKSI